MADIAPMLGAILGISKSKGKKSAGKPKAAVVMAHPAPTAAPEAYKPPTDKQRTRENAKNEMRHATDSWVSGHLTTQEHSAVHARAKHVLSGKEPREFKGKSGERKMKGLR